MKRSVVACWMTLALAIAACPAAAQKKIVLVTPTPRPLTLDGELKPALNIAPSGAVESSTAAEPEATPEAPTQQKKIEEYSLDELLSLQEAIEARIQSLSGSENGAVLNIGLDEKEITLLKGKSIKLSPSVYPKDAANPRLDWVSSDRSVAYVKYGNITAKGVGECEVTCTAADGFGAEATCHVTVVQPVTGIRLEEKSVTGYIGTPAELHATVLPEDASNAVLEWTSTDEKVAKVDENGRLRFVGSGTCEIICKSTDGTDRTAQTKIYVPSISVSDTTFEVTEKDGLAIPVKYYGTDPEAFSWSSSGKSFTVEQSEINGGYELTVLPVTAGKGTIMLKDQNDPNGTVKLSVVVNHSAVYDAKSYPPASYDAIMRYPEEQAGNNASVSGKVIGKQDDGADGITLLLSVKGKTERIYCLTYDQQVLDVRVLEGDQVTAYGEIQGLVPYTDEEGNTADMPYLIPEKIVIGK